MKNYLSHFVSQKLILCLSFHAWALEFASYKVALLEIILGVDFCAETFSCILMPHP